MKRYTNKLLIFILALVVSVTPLLVIVPSAKAEMFDTTLQDYQQDLDGEKYNKEIFDFQSLIGVSSSLLTLLVGCTDPSCPQSIRTGAMYKVTDTIAILYDNPPASGIYYALDLGNNLHIIRPAYAQTGIGFNVLIPFLDLWRAIRNLTYVLFVIGAIALGLMIMFRTKISPQATMTVQSAMPRIIVALILVTISYAIVGFVFDLIYVSFAILAWSFQPANIPNYNAANTFNEFANAGFGQTASFILGQGVQGAWDVIRGSAANPSIAIGGGLVALVGTALAVIFPAVAAAMGIALIPLALGLVLAIIGFLVRTLIVLARAYITLLIYLIFGPLIILWGTLTGRSFWEAWLRTVVSNSLVFFAIGTVIFIANILIQTIDRTVDAGGTIFGPPYLGNQHNVLKGIIAFGAVVILPQLPDIINQLIGVRFPQVGLPGGRLAEQYGQGVSGRLERTGFARPPAGAGWRAATRWGP